MKAASTPAADRGKLGSSLLRARMLRQWPKGAEDHGSATPLVFALCSLVSFVMISPFLRSRFSGPLRSFSGSADSEAAPLYRAADGLPESSRALPNPVSLGSLSLYLKIRSHSSL